MCSEPKKLAEEGVMDLAIKFSTWPPAFWLHTKAEIGSAVSMRVGGDFHYPNAVSAAAAKDHRLLLIAGGVGINPLASIYFRASAEPEVKAKLLFSASSTQELIFRHDLDAIARAKTTFSTEYFVTKQASVSDDFVTLGRITEADLERVLREEPLGKTLCYLCGPPAMIQSMAASLETLGVNKNHIFFELWW